MMDRGIIKWQPFNSCFSSSKIKEEIDREKHKEIMPTLSEDQQSEISEKIFEAYATRIPVELKVFFDENLKILRGKITHIDFQRKKIYLNNQIVYFQQILNIKINIKK